MDINGGATNNGRQRLKQSSADLQSRLKSRKLLGVGVTDDGLDIHRSKLSQILGQNDAMINASRIPAGIQWWNFFLSALLVLSSFWSLLIPGHYNKVVFGGSQSATTLYSTCLFCLSFPLMAMSQTFEKISSQWILMSTQILLLVHCAGAFYGAAFQVALFIFMLLLANTWFLLGSSSDTSRLLQLLRKFSQQREEDSYKSYSMDKKID